MSPRDLVYGGHMLDMARKAVTKPRGLSREAYDGAENLRLALIHLRRKCVLLCRPSHPNVHARLVVLHGDNANAAGGLTIEHWPAGWTAYRPRPSDGRSVNL